VRKPPIPLNSVLDSLVCIEMTSAKKQPPVPVKNWGRPLFRDVPAAKLGKILNLGLQSVEPTNSASEANCGLI
jgi:hypothetical protein